MASEVVLSAKSLGLLQDVSEEAQPQPQQSPPPATAPAGSPVAAAGPGGVAIGKTNVLAAAANLVGLEAGSCEVGGDEEMDETLKAEDDEEEDDDDIDSEDEGGEGMVKIDGLTGDAAFEKRGRHTGAKALFLQKLYDILENDENNDYVVWANNGEHILIKDPEGLSNKVLPKYYNHSNFKSFVRQLHMYSFRKLQVDPDGDCYRCIFQQPRFKRGQRHLLKTIKRKTSSLGSMTRISTAKVTNVLKDLADMRHELRANASRMVMMEKHLRMMTARCNLLEEERRTYAHHQGMPPHLPLPPELKDVAGSYGSGAPNSASAAAAAAVSYANAQAAAAQQAAHVAALGNGDSSSLAYGGPFGFPGGSGPQQMQRGPNGGPPQEPTTVFFGDPQQQQHHPFQQQHQQPQHHPGMHPQQQQHPHGPPQYMMQQGGGPPHMQQQQQQQQMPMQQQQQQQQPPGYGGGPGGMNPYQIGGMSPPPSQGGGGSAVNGGADHSDDRFGGSTGGGGEPLTQGQQPIGQQQQQFDFPLQSPGMSFAPMPGMPSGAQQTPIGTTSMASGGQGPSYTTTAAGGGGPPPTMAPPGGAPTRADGAYGGTADGAPMAAPFPGGPPQPFKPTDQQFFNSQQPGGGPPNGQPYVLSGAPQPAPLGGGTSSGLFLSAVSASVDSNQTTLAVSQA